MNELTKDTPAGTEKMNDCGCEGDCCPPKKKNPFTKILFAVVLLAAIAIVAVKLTHKADAPPAKASCCPEGSAGCCDTTKKSTCDTTKGSSCCPK